MNRERNLNYSWPEEIRDLNSAREKRRAHMKAVVWREQVLLDDVDAKTLGNDACVLELTLSKRMACEVFAAAVKSVKRVRRLMLDSGCGFDLIGLGDLSRDERDFIAQNAKICLRTANGKTNAKGVAHMRVEWLEELIEAYVLESTRSLLSLGKRCTELGYRFIWDPFGDPIFFDPKGKRLKIDVIITTSRISRLARLRLLLVALTFRGFTPRYLHRLLCVRRLLRLARHLRMNSMILESLFWIARGGEGRIPVVRR